MIIRRGVMNEIVTVIENEEHDENWLDNLVFALGEHGIDAHVWFPFVVIHATETEDLVANSEHAVVIHSDGSVSLVAASWADKFIIS